MTVGYPPIPYSDMVRFATDYAQPAQPDRHTVYEDWARNIERAHEFGTWVANRYQEDDDENGQMMCRADVDLRQAWGIWLEETN